LESQSGTVGNELEKLEKLRKQNEDKLARLKEELNGIAEENNILKREFNRT